MARNLSVSDRHRNTLWFLFPGKKEVPVLELRPYQQQAIEGVFAAWMEFDRVLGVAPTGAGKTINFAHIAVRRIDVGSVLILAHRDELLTQATDKIVRAVGLRAAREHADNYADLSRHVVVASVQPLSRSDRLNRFPRNHFRSVIDDEAHHSGTFLHGDPHTYRPPNGRNVICISSATPTHGA
jgi:superfamily II DNA or RNA helicase